LRAPSMLHDYHHMRSAIGGQLSPTGKQIEEMLPERIQLWLYRWALDRGNLDTIIERWVIAPLSQLSNYLSRKDRTRAPSPTTIRPGRAVQVPSPEPAQRSN
jgi:NADH-quinone oxidoreductase subunit L